MALCDKPCCNAAAREAIRAQREADFEAFLARREAAKPMTLGDVAAPEADMSFEEAIARIGRANEGTFARILLGKPFTADELGVDKRI